MIAKYKLNLSRNKRLDTIRKKKSKIIKSLQENTLDVAKAKMDSLIIEKGLITFYDILNPLLEILKEELFIQLYVLNVRRIKNQIRFGDICLN